LNKYFGPVGAVQNLNLRVKDKEFLSLLGPSGCGKTTTIRITAGLESPTSGSVFIGDQLVNELHPKDRDVAMVFQTYALYPHMTVYDNIAFPLKMRKYSSSEIGRRVKDIASLLRIEDLLNRKPKALSGGQQQRVSLGRAIVREPKVFLMDEPLSNLDAKLRLYMRVELKSLQRKLGITTIYVTHDQVEAMTMSDRIALMNGGVLQQVSRPDEIYANPTNEFVAGFIGSPPMNFIDCSFVEKDDKGLLDAGPFTFDVTSLKDLIKHESAVSEILMGVRPDDLIIDLQPAQDSIEAEVFLVEPMGSELIVNLKVGESLLKSRVLSTSFKINSEKKVWLHIDKNKIHLFDKHTGKAIL
jgi:multiple sugar transport system ATP-binding protein